MSLTLANRCRFWHKILYDAELDLTLLIGGLSVYFNPGEPISPACMTLRTRPTSLLAMCARVIAANEVHSSFTPLEIHIPQPDFIAPPLFAQGSIEDAFAVVPHPLRAILRIEHALASSFVRYDATSQ